MLLRSARGESVELRVLGYELDHTGPPTGGTDTDANWLVVEGTVRRADGTTFTFADPCLLTDEAPRLSDWLRAVAGGLCEPVRAWDFYDPPTGMLTFVEPDLAWSVQGYTPATVVLRVHLSAEASPPWATGLAGDFYQLLDVRRDALEAAAAEWQDEIRRYPVR
jgi:hypothetical protein